MRGIRAFTTVVALVAPLAVGCGTTEPGGFDEITGRWTYVQWEFDYPDGLVEYIRDIPASGSLEIRADSSFRLEEFAGWSLLGGRYRQRIEGRAELEGGRLTLVYPDGTWQFDVELSENTLLLERIGERPAPAGDAGTDAAPELIGLVPDVAPPALTGRVAFTGTGPGVGTDVYVMNADGTGRIRLTDHPLPDYDPSWSPDGSRIAFVSERDGNAEIYVMNADGSDQLRLTDDPAYDQDPDWGPVGRIAFSRRPADAFSPASIHLMADDGSGLVQVRPEAAPADAGHSRPAWAPDGSRIAFVSRIAGGPGEIHSMLPDGSGAVALVDPLSFEVSVTSPTWAPGADRIAYILSERSIVLQIEGAGTIGDGRNPGDPVWVPAGAVLFESYDDLYVAHESGDGIQNLTRTDFPVFSETMADWTP